MNHTHDAFLETQAAAQEAKGRTPDTITLIAALREHQEIGLKEAKDIVDDFLHRRGPSTPHTAIEDYDTWLTAQIAQIEAQDEKPDRLMLIRHLREQSNMGIQEAKDIVDAYCAAHCPEMPTAAGPGVLEQISKILGLR